MDSNHTHNWQMPTQADVTNGSEVLFICDCGELKLVTAYAGK